METQVIISQKEHERLLAIEKAFNEDSAYIDIWYCRNYPVYQLIGKKDIIKILESEKAGLTERINELRNKVDKYEGLYNKEKNKTWFQKLIS